MAHRAGFVNIIGNPNVGKSTLMNALVGEKLSIVTAKAQTTRHRIMGIVSGEDYQIVYSDTPGILKPNYRLQQSMLDFVDTAIGDADIILYVTDTVEKGDKNEAYIEKLAKVECPVVLVINKIDISSQEKVVELMQWWHEKLPKAEIIPASAQEKFNLHPGGGFQPPSGSPGLVRQGPVHRQEPPLLRLGDPAGEDLPQLRRGDPLQLPGGDRGLP